jgi:GSH-dependent disulfide-bond oxidoreductase
MIELYSANTPNGQRAAVALEEFGLPYHLHKVAIFQGGAATPEFRKINPRERIPVIIDPEGPGGRPITLSQSWAICLYLAEKTGRFVPSDATGRLEVVQWLFHLGTDVAAANTSLNQVSNFVPEKVPSTIGFYEQRFLSVLANLDQHLGGVPYFAGDLSVADFSFYPVYNFRRSLLEKHPEFGNLIAWGARMDKRPACVRGVQALQ